jgi:hypothetical protein
MCSARGYCGQGITYDFKKCILKLQIHTGTTAIRQGG